MALNKVLITTSVHLDLAKKIAKALKLPLLKVLDEKFPDGEWNINLNKSFFGTRPIILHSTCPPVNERLVQLLLIIDAVKRGGAQKISVIIPYFGYSRQDKIFKMGQPLSAKLVAGLIEKAGASEVFLIDLHQPTEVGFFDIPAFHINPVSLYADYIKRQKIKKGVVVSPDLGGIKRAKELAKALNFSLGFIDKERDIETGRIKSRGLFANVKDKDVIIVDDIISSGSTLVKASQILKSAGAKKIWAFVTHAVLNNQTPSLIEESPIKKLIVTDACSFPKKLQFPKLEIVSLAPLIKEVIKCHLL